ncbi:unnamed protein product [Microthlaspi erraticum]|uniref:RING-type E3 ubiquitin transferase n=1 Tax=Microthlaspi erraticum TaxID=1685480 RepID=A0A6D2IVC9_9BRAS|nr:unnamed protein product [Microthlaspi erraticum]CAA7037572.1 unnamed protein product [Microthlaspi erraticum]
MVSCGGIISFDAIVFDFLQMLNLAVYLSCGATAYYLLGRRIKKKADFFNSITRVIELKWLDDLLKEKTTNLLVVVSGRVGSAAPLECKHNGLLSVLLEEKGNVDFEIELGDGSMIKKSLNFLLQQRETPWYLEDSTGRVNIVGAQSAIGFDATLNEYALNMPVSELLDKLVKPEGFKVLQHSCHERALAIGTTLTFVGEAVRDKAGHLMIQEPKKQPFMVFTGEGSFDKMVDGMMSDSETYIFYSKIFGTIAVAVAIMYGVDFIRRVLSESEKRDLGNRSDNGKSRRPRNRR